QEVVAVPDARALNVLMRLSSVNRYGRSLGLLLVRGSLLRFLKGFQHLFGSRAHGDVFSEIYPADCSARINQELRRTRDVCAFRSCGTMHEIVTPNHFRPRVRQERISITKFLSLTSIDFRRVDTNRDNLNPA